MLFDIDRMRPGWSPGSVRFQGEGSVLDTLGGPSLVGLRGRRYANSGCPFTTRLLVDWREKLTRLKGPCEWRFSQADKRAWWMPWHEPAMKDVASCDKPRGAASERRSGDVRMGKPSGNHIPLSRKGSQPGELKHLITQRKRNQTRLP